MQLPFAVRIDPNLSAPRLEGPRVTVSGLHELVANALVMKGEIPRTMNLRQEDLANPDPDPADSEEA